MAFSEVIDLNTVLANHLGFYQITLSNWGNAGTGADPNSIISPVFTFPLAGIAIDPESTVERVVIRPRQNGTVNPGAGITQGDVSVDKDSPLSARLSFPRVKGFDGGWAFVATLQERYTDAFFQLDGSVAPFGGAVVPGSSFVKPGLLLMLSLDGGKPDIRIPKRMPFVNQFQIGVAPVATQRFMPIAGRKKIRITARQESPPGAAPVTIHIRGIASGRQDILTEFELAPDLVVPVGGPNVSALIQHPLCHYLHLVAESVGVSSARVIVEARDDD
jgi:hypothetical protein